MFVQDLNRKIDLANAAAAKSVEKLRGLQAEFARAKAIRDKKAAANANRLAMYGVRSVLLRDVPAAVLTSCGRWTPGCVRLERRGGGKPRCCSDVSSTRSPTSSEPTSLWDA